MAVFSRARLSRLTFLKVFCLLTSLSDLKMIGVFTSKFSRVSLPTPLTLSESEKQVFLRDFRLTLAKRPEKLLVKTRPMQFSLNLSHRPR